jgi:hypothetical protein
MRAQEFRWSVVNAAVRGAIAACAARRRPQVLQRMPLARTCADGPPRIVAALFMVQESACFPGKCTTTVQFTTASITSVFQKQSVVKDHFSSAVKPVNRVYNKRW